MTEVAVRAVKLDSVKSSFEGTFSRVPVLLDQSVDIVNCGFAWNRLWDGTSLVRMDGAGCYDGRRGDDANGLVLVQRMADTSDMHQLASHLAARIMDRLKYWFPPVNLFSCVNAGCARVSLPLPAWLYAFRDYQTSGRTLPVVFNHDRCWHTVP